MANGVELATGYVTLTVQTKSLGAQIGKAFAGGEGMATAAGKAMGKSMSKAFTENQPDMDKLADDVKWAEERAAAYAERAAVRMESAKSKVAIAQAKLNETYDQAVAKMTKENDALVKQGKAQKLSSDAIDKQVRSSSAYLTAVDRLSTAQQKSEATTLATADAQRKLKTEVDTAKDALNKASSASTKSANTYAKGWKGLGQRLKVYMVGGVKSAGKEAEVQAERSGKTSGSKFSGAFKGAFAGVFAGASVGAIFKEIGSMTTLAASAEQSVGAIDTVFKENAQVMQDWAKNAKTAVGISANEYRELGTLLGSQLKNMGTPMGELADKTNGLVKLGADMASMYGGTTKEAVEALSSALKGEMDPIERYGITLNQAALEAEGLSKGILKPVVDSEKVTEAATKMTLAQKKYSEVVKKHGKESDQAQRAQLALTSAERAYEKATAGKVPKLEGEAKALAVQSALYSQSADAAGNFAREEDTAEHKRQVASASWADLKEKIGNMFLPAMTAAFGYIGEKALPALDRLIDGIKGVGALLINGDYTGAMSDAFGIEEDHPLVGFLIDVGNLVRDNAKWMVPLTVSVLAGWAAWKLYNGATSLYTSIGKTLTTMIKNQTVAQWALNAAMNANWVGIIIAAIVALVAGFIYLWKTNEGFRNFWISAWEKIVSVIGGAWNGIQAAFQWISGGLGWLGGVFSGVWQAIVGFVEWGVNGIISVAGVIGDFFRNSVAPVFVWLYENIVKPIWTGIQYAIAIAAVPITLVVMGLVNLFKYVLAPVFIWLYENVVKPVWNWISGAIKTAWVIIKVVFGAINSFIRGTLAKVFTWFRDSVIKPVWSFITSTISKAWSSIKVIFGYITAGIKFGLSVAFTVFRKLVETVWSGIKTFISRTWTGIKIIFQAIGNFLRDTLGPVFKWLYDKIIKPVWDGIKATISYVWNNGIKPIFEAFGNFIRDKVAPVFQKGVDKITAIWDTIKAAAKAPIKFVIDTVINNGLIKAFNTVAGWLPGVKELDPVSIPGFARGGWTGPGTKYQEAGIVHADEFVIRKESQRSIERTAPGFMDSLNRFGAKALGYATGGLVRPIKSGAITSRFGASRGKYPHAGTDFAVPVGTPVFAAMDGQVTKAGTNAITGRTGIGAFLSHEGGRNTYYGHLSRLMVQVGDMVRKGQQIALSGNTGKSTGPHLHFETWVGGKPVNAEPYLNGAMLPEGGVGGGGGNPLQALLDLGGKITGWFTDKFPGAGMMVDIAKGTSMKLVDSVKDWASSKLDAIGDWAKDKWNGVTDWATGKSGTKKAVRSVANNHGWGDGDQWNAILELVGRESSWDMNAANSQSNARGLFQKMTSMHGPVESTAEGQAQWGLNYIKQRYGNPVSALNFHTSRGWYADGGLVKSTLYDTGGWLQPGFTPIMNLTGRKEAIYTESQNRDLQTLASYAHDKINSERDGESGDTYNVVVPKGATVDDIVDAIEFEKRRKKRG